MENSSAARFGIGFNVVLGMFNAFLFFQLNQIASQFRIHDERIHAIEQLGSGFASSLSAIAVTVSRNTDIVKKLDEFAADPDRHRMGAVETQLHELQIQLARCIPQLGPKQGGQ